MKQHAAGMHEQPLVSVIITSYNHEQYISQAVNSVLEQSYPRVELIVIDDGSSDKSPGIIAELARQHGFAFVRQTNHGVGHALNNAIKNHASGDYIAVLASDDYYHPDKLEKQIDCLHANPSSELCFTQAIEFESSDGQPLRTYPQANFQGQMLQRIFLRQPYAAGSILYSRRLFDKLGGYDENLKLEDWDFLIRAAAETSICGVYEPLCYYRSHASNTFKVLNRRKIYSEKKRVLLKNRHIVSFPVLLRSLIAHFVYDYWLCRVKSVDFRGMFH